MTPSRAIGAALDRLDGPAKVQGIASYAFEHPVDHPAYLHPVQATIATGQITGIDTAAAAAVPGVLAVLTHRNAPRLAATDDAELAILQFDQVAFRGQFVGGVIADTPEIARHAASLVRLDYAERAHDTELRADRDDLYAPEHLNGGFPTNTAQGDVDAALASAAVRLDQTYRTALYLCNPMEPHATIASWNGDKLRGHRHDTRQPVPHSSSPCTASGHSSPRYGCARTAARCGSPGCWACSPPARSSTRRPAAPSCSAG
jgi:xanthine dehydrogenase YagR molybdenum-binding subunit